MTASGVDHSRWAYLHFKDCSIGLPDCQVCHLIAEIERLQAIVDTCKSILTPQELLHIKRQARLELIAQLWPDSLADVEGE